MPFLYLQFSQKFDFMSFLLWYRKSNCFRSYFGKIEDTKKTFQNWLTFTIQNIYLMLHNLMHHPSTGSKRFWTGPNFLCQSYNGLTYCVSTGPKMFCVGPNVLIRPKIELHLVLLQNILGRHKNWFY